MKTVVTNGSERGVHEPSYVIAILQIRSQFYDVVLSMFTVHDTIFCPICLFLSHT